MTLRRVWRGLLSLGVVVLLVAAGRPSQAQTTTTYTYDALGRLVSATTNTGYTSTFAYDAAGNRTQQTIVPPAPTVGAATLSVAYNTSGSVALSPSGVYTSLAVASGPAHGSASISGTTATYTPNSGYYGSDSFTYTATGPGGTSGPATVSVTVGPPAPSAGAVSLSVGYNASGSVSLAPSGVYTSLALSSGPSHGSASVSGTTASYTPNSGYYGADSFTYTVSGPGGTSAPGTVSVTVANPAAPTVGNVSLSVGYNASGSVGLTPGGVYSSLSVASGPGHGSASISGTTATYTPNSGYYGSDSFTYTATGPGGTSGTATVSVSVGNPPAPTVGNVSLNVGYNSSGSVGLSPSGVYSSLAIASGPAHGSASISGATASYTPNSGYYGSDSFTYTATGPGGTSGAATVSVLVATPAAPTVGNASLSVGYNSSGSVGLSPSGVYNSLSIASGPAHGSASISGTTATYTPNSGYYGSDSFTYTATGPGGTSGAATVSVSVGAPPAPTVGNASLSVNYNTSGSVGLSPSGVYSSLSIASGPGHGSASISGTTATYTPDSGFSGSDSFTYTASGPGGTSSPATVSVSVGSPLGVSLNQTYWSWYEYLSQSPSISSNIVASASGGAGGYSYAWQYVSGDTAMSATNASSASTGWTRSPTPTANNQIYTSTWRCKITDSAGTVVYSSNVSVTFEHDNND